MRWMNVLSSLGLCSALSQILKVTETSGLLLYSRRLLRAV